MICAHTPRHRNIARHGRPRNLVSRELPDFLESTSWKNCESLLKNQTGRPYSAPYGGPYGVLLPFLAAALVFPASRRLLVQPEVGSVVVIVGNVLGDESLQMALIQRDHMVEQVAAAASDPTLGDPILPGTPNRGTDRCHVQRAHRRWHFRSEERRVGKECRSRWSPYN